MLPGNSIVYYLLQFYLFAFCGALSYLSARAWLDPSSSSRKTDSPRVIARWGHVIRGIVFGWLAAIALLSALFAPAVNLHFDLVALSRSVGWLCVLLLIPGNDRFSRLNILSLIFLALGEATVAWQSTATTIAARWRPEIAFALLDIGITLLFFALRSTVLRLRLLDRMVISFAVFSMLLAQIVAVLFISILYSIGLGITKDQLGIVVENSEDALVITLSFVLVTSGVVAFYLARDLSAPLNRLVSALRSIGEGDLDYRVQLSSPGDDEMHDLAREVNRMAHRLKRAEGMRAEFFSFVSHELRSPLTAIRGFVDTLRDNQFSDPERVEIYEIIHDESDRLLRMIGELLDISRIETGRPLLLAWSRFDAVRHAEKILGIMRGQTTRHHLNVEKSTEELWLVADPDKFDQILINLLSNAIKYSPDGGTITVNLARDDDFAVISVRDHGVGMTSSQVRHVFEKYYRVAEQDGASMSPLARVEGSGIGLYLTRALVEAHGGTITVESEVGVGSTFIVRMPVRANDAIEDGASDGQVADASANFATTPPD